MNQPVTRRQRRPSRTIYERFGKRALDACLACCGLIVSAPLLALIGLCVLLLDGSPVVFRQNRLGRCGAQFTLYKFRTMVVGAHRSGSITTATDPRITRLGSFLRRTKLDELPQLYNVLLGDMALVGPRPEVPEYAHFFTEDAADILAVRPGLTGPASLVFKDEAQLLAGVADPGRYNDEVLLPAKIELNLHYIEACSLGLDLRILAQTALSLILAHEATPPDGRHTTTSRSHDLEG